EHVDQVEEQLDIGDPLGAGPSPDQIQWPGLAHAVRSRLTSDVDQLPIMPVTSRPARRRRVEPGHPRWAGYRKRTCKVGRTGRCKVGDDPVNSRDGVLAGSSRTEP